MAEGIVVKIWNVTVNKGERSGASQLANSIQYIENPEKVAMKICYRCVELLSPHKKLHIGQSTQRSYREIGSLVIGLQGEDRAKYGAEIIKSWQKNYRLNMEEVIQSRIYIAFILSIRPTLKFSRHRLENLLDYCLGRIMQHYYRLKMRKLETGMRKKQ